MNATEENVVRWLDGEMDAEELAGFEGWLEQQPDADQYWELKIGTQRWQEVLREVEVKEEEPPYADFFHHRIQSSIVRDYLSKPRPQRVFSLWKRLVSPVFACSLAFCAFWLGLMQSHSANPEIRVDDAPKAIVVESLTYTPQEGVSAKWVKEKEGVKVLVMSGLAPLSDQVELESNHEP